MPNLLFPLILALLTNFLIFGKLLSFSLGGDDWLSLYRYLTSFDGFTSFFDLKRFTGNYDVANILMGVLYEIFGINPFPYFFTALIFRSLASLSIYLLVNKIVKNKRYAVLVLLIYSASYSGIQSLDWVFNMSSYLSIFFLNLFLVFWINDVNKVKNKSTDFFVSAFFLFLSFITTPNRIYGIFLLVPLLESVRLFKKRDLAGFTTRTVVYLLPAYFFRKITAAKWDSVYISYFQNSPGISFFQKAGFLIANLYSAMLPDSIMEKFLKTSGTNTNKIKIIVALFIFSSFILIFVKNFKKEIRVSLAGLISFLGVLIFETAPWLVYSSSVFPSAHRYHVVSTSFFVLSFVFLLYLVKKGKVAGFVYILTFVFLLANIISGNNYLNDLYDNGRNQKEVAPIFDEIQNRSSPITTDSLTVFLFEADNSQYVYNAVTFGFAPHMMILNPELIDHKEIAPLAVDNIESLMKIMHGDQEELRRYGYKTSDLEIGNVFKFVI